MDSTFTSDLGQLLGKANARKKGWIKGCVQMRRFVLKLFFSVFLMGLLISSLATEGLAFEKQQLHATSSEISLFKGTYIVLYWSPAEDVVGYNLYRKEAAERAYPSFPLNGKALISTVKTCEDLKAVIPEGSSEWNMLKGAFFSLLPRETSSEKEVGPLAKGEVVDPKTPELFPRLRSDLIAAAADPCTVLQRGLTEEEGAIFDLLAKVNLKLRLARGLAFIDDGVIGDARYVYQLRGVLRGGGEVILGPEVGVWAGHFILPDPPEDLTAIAGDHTVLSLWDRNPEAYSYTVRRATHPFGPHQVINAQPVFFDIAQDLEGEDIVPPRPGFVDHQRFDDDKDSPTCGHPTTHDVAGVAIDGPENGVTYYYQVASCDILDRVGSWSPEQSVTPVDLTPPKAPTQLAVDPLIDPMSPGLVLSWRKVTQDIEGHRELDTTQTYMIYRADTLEALDDIAGLPTYFVHSLTADPIHPAVMTISWTDTDPAIIPMYGEKDFWYRVRCVDASPQANMSAPSAAISGRVPDTTPPGPTYVTGAEGYADHITAMWAPNTEPDLGGYQIYRSVCDFGVPYRPPLRPDLTQYEPTQSTCDFALVGEVLVREARKRLEETGRIYYEDYSVPEGSPICYAYWVRAFDMARNLYPGNLGTACPDVGEYICQRLYEETPPPAPIISGLKAKNNSVFVEWVSSPVQDLHAFHVYRSKEEDGSPIFVACIFLDGTMSTTPWMGTHPSCDDIPADPDPTAVFGSFMDKGLEPNQVFWYRVAAVDWLGNESERGNIEAIPAISTFTYSKDLPGTPTVLPPATAAPSGCGLVVRWTPFFDPAELLGFIVFRSTSPGGSFRQVSPVIEGNEFVDESAIRGISYWYRVQAMDLTGKLSEPSAAVEYSY